MAAIDFRFRVPTPEFNAGSSGIRDDLWWRTSDVPLWRPELEPQPPEGVGPSFDDCLEWMDANGVVGVVPGRKLTHTRVDNDFLFSLQKGYPGLFIAVPAVDGTNVEQAAAEAEHFAAAGAIAIHIEPGMYRPALLADDRSLYPLYAACERAGLIALIHCGPYGGPDFGHSNPAAVCNVARDFPNLRIVIAHGGFPFVREAILTVFQHDNVWLAPGVYFDRPGGELYLEWANQSDAVASRLLWSSAMGWPSAAGALERFTARELRADVAEQILWSNGAALLGLDQTR